MNRDKIFRSGKDGILNGMLTEGWRVHYQTSHKAHINRYPDGFVDPSAQIHPSVKMGKGCVIMPNVVIEKDVILGDNVVITGDEIFKHKAIVKKECIIGNNSHVDSSKIGEYSKIGENTGISTVKIGHKVTIGNHCRIASFTVGDRTEIGDSVYIDILGYVGNDVTIGKRNYIGEWVKIKNHVKLNSECVILEESIIKSGANLNNVFIKNEAVVGANSKISNTLLEWGSKIKSNQEIDNNKNITPKSNFFSFA